MSKRGNAEGSVSKRRDGRWEARVSLGYANGRRQRKAFYAKTRQEAARKLLAAQRAVSDGLPISGDRQTVGALLEAGLTDSAARKVRPRTLQRYRQIVKLHLTPRVGSVTLAKLTPRHVEFMMNEALAAGVSPRSAAHHRAVLRTALNVAMRWGLVRRNVASLADTPRVPEHEVRPLSQADARALLEAVRGDRLEALFAVGLAVGLRQSEALGLTWGDVSLDIGTLTVQRTLQRIDGEWLFLEPKTARSRRTLPLPGAAVAALRQHRVRQAQERLRLGPAWEGDKWGDLVFTDEAGGPPSRLRVSRRLRALTALAGLPSMRYHDLRHGAASLMAAQGVPMRTAVEMLGHSQISTTANIYAHVASELTRDAADRIGAALWGKS